MRPVWRAIGWAIVVFVVWQSLTSHPISIGIEQGDKFEHVAAYATLMLWFAQLETGLRSRVAYAIGFIALGVALEFAQRLTDYRTFDVADMVANSAGVLAGWMVSPPRGPDITRFVERVVLRVS